MSDAGSTSAPTTSLRARPSAENPEFVLDAAEVPNRPAWYVLGCREAARVTFYTQQVRALNLAWALREAGKVSPSSRVLIVGAGAAGLTLAGALAHFKAHVRVLEKESDTLPLQRNCYKRHLHPHIYDWPTARSTRPSADLPILNWRAGMARDVVAAIDEGFADLCLEHGDRLDVITGISNLELDSPSAGKVTFRRRLNGGSTGHRRCTEPYDLLIFAIGFGVEHSHWLGTRGSYWADDSLDQGGVFQPGEYLVSGTGDGGLIDVLRIAIRNFRQEDLARIVEQTSSFEALREELLDIDKCAAEAGPREESVLFARYQSIPRNLVEYLDRQLERRLNPMGKVTLLSRGRTPFSLKASSLHRLLLARLYFEFPHVLDHRPGVTLEERHLRAERSKVVFAHERREMTFDYVIVRHGPRRALDAIPDLRDIANLAPSHDRSVRALFGSAFGPRRGPVTWVGGATKHDYLLALEDLVSYVPGVDGDPIPVERFTEVAVEIYEHRVTPTELPAPKSDDDSSENARKPLAPGADEGEDAARLAAKRYVVPSPGHAVLPAEHPVLGITLLVGKAGVGKSVFLKLAARGAVQRHRRSADVETQGPLPLFLSGPVELDDSDDSVANAIVEAALRTLQVSSFTVAGSELRRALKQRRAVLFIDAVDDWSPDDFDRLLDWLVANQLPALISGRRMPAALRGRRAIGNEHELRGIVPSAATTFVRGHFPGAAEGDPRSIERVLATLRKLPNHDEWLATPFLLSRAAWLLFERPELRDGALSRSLLYEEVVSDGIARVVDERRDVIRTTLERIAREDLFHAKVRLTFSKDRLPYEERVNVLETGLVSGGRLLEYAHQSLAEYLASKTIDCDVERKKLRDEEPASWRHHLEVLPMAHARRAASLRAALGEVSDEDSEHRLLLLVLRAIAYGGVEVEQFCLANRNSVVSLVGQRLTHSSGRFGDAERTLMRAFERAAPFLQGASVDDLRGVGEPGAEAWVLQTLLDAPGTGEPPPGSIYWSTIFAQARRLLPRTPDEVFRLTSGGGPFNRLAALRALAGIGQVPEDVRPVLYDRVGRLRADAIRALHRERHLSHRFMGMFADDEEMARMFAWHAQETIAEEWSTEARQDVVRTVLRSKEESAETKSAALELLTRRDADLDLLLDLLRSVTAMRDSWTSGETTLLQSLLAALASEPRARKTIDEFLRAGPPWFFPTKGLVQLYVGDAARTAILEARLRTDDVTAHEIEAASEIPALLPGVRDLVHRLQQDPRRSHPLATAIRSLPLNDHDSRQARLTCLTPAFVPEGDHDFARERGTIRMAAIRSFKGDPQASEVLRDALYSEDEDEAAAAIEALGDDRRAIERAWTLVRSGTTHARAAIAKTLAALATEQDKLWTFLKELPPQSFGGDRTFTSFVRTAIVGALATTRPSDDLLPFVADPDEYVRVGVATALLDSADGAVRERLVERALTEADSPVQELLWRKFASEPRVQQHLLDRLRADRSETRSAYYLLLSDEPDGLHKLRERHRAVGDDADLELLAALARDGEMREELRRLFDSADDRVRRQLLRVMRGDAELRRRAHRCLESLETARSLFGLSMFGSDLERYFADDVTAKAILTEGLGTRKLEPLARSIIPILRGYGPAKTVLHRYIDDAIFGDEAQAALVDEPEAQRILRQRLGNDDHHERRIAAEALESVPSAQEELAKRIDDSDEHVRRVAYRAAFRTPARSRDVPRLLRAFEGETKENARIALAAELARHEACDAVVQAAFQERLARERSAVVRSIATGVLNRARPGAPLRHDESVRRAVAALALNGELHAFVMSPSSIAEATSKELFDGLVAWACTKLVSTLPSRAGEMRGHLDSAHVVFGEMPPKTTVTSSRQIRLRLSGDAVDLARDRDILPAANVIAIWDVLSNVVASEPLSIVVACADVDFDSLPFPSLPPDSLLFGPMFFGVSLKTPVQSTAERVGDQTLQPAPEEVAAP